MRIAYLIIAHNEWDVLRLLISKLDYEGNDIYLHFDKKVKDVPEFHCEKSRLHVLNKRIDVRWGTVKQIECEILLFEEAMNNGPYDFYILISGVHLPLKSPKETSDWFKERLGYSIFSNLRKSGKYQETLKLRRYNLFLSNYQSKYTILKYLCQAAWKLAISVQKVFKIYTNKGCEFYWANNWAAFSHDAIEYLVSNKKRILKKYKFSFCGDEYFAPSELMESKFENRVINENLLLYCNIEKANASTYSIEKDYPKLCNTGYIFARKFSTKK